MIIFASIKLRSICVQYQASSNLFNMLFFYHCKFNLNLFWININWFWPVANSKYYWAISIDFHAGVNWLWSLALKRYFFFHLHSINFQLINFVYSKHSRSNYANICNPPNISSMLNAFYWIQIEYFKRHELEMYNFACFQHDGLHVSIRVDLSK